MSERISNLSSRLLSDNHYILRRYDFRYRLRDGTQADMAREVYDRGNGATILLYNRARQSVILTRQFRLPAYLNGVEDGLLIETPAGLLDADSPTEAIRREAVEETGYRIGPPQPVFDLFMSPGAVTERVHFFTAEVSEAHRMSEGGGLAEEHEDIEVLDIPFAQALAMLRDGRIRDGKTAILLLHAKATDLLD